MAHGSRKRPLDFGGNPDHCVGVGLWLDGAPPYFAQEEEEEDFA